MNSIKRKWHFLPNGVGRVCIYYYEDEPNISYMSSLFVHEKERGNGCGKELIFWSIDNFKGEKLILKCKNELQYFYEKFGFSFFETCTDDNDSIWMIFRKKK